MLLTITTVSFQKNYVEPPNLGNKISRQLIFMILFGRKLQKNGI